MPVERQVTYEIGAKLAAGFKAATAAASSTLGRLGRDGTGLAAKQQAMASASARVVSALQRVHTAQVQVAESGDAAAKASLKQARAEAQAARIFEQAARVEVRAAKEAAGARARLAAPTAGARGNGNGWLRNLVVGAGAGYAAQAAGRFALEKALDFEQTGIAYEVMLKSEKKAQDLLRVQERFAALTPYTSPEVQAAGRTLMTAGVGTADQTRVLTQIGDVAAGTHQPLTELAAIYAKIRMSNRVYGDEMLQFNNRGIPLMKEMAAVMGVNVEDLRKLGEQGKITFDVFNKAWLRLTEKGGMFHGNMAKQSQSMGGLWSTIEDNAGIAAKNAVLRYKGPLQQLERWIIRQLPAWEKGLYATLDAVGKWWDANKDTLISFAGTLAQTWERMQPVVGWLFNQGLPAVLTLATKILDVFNRMPYLVEGLAAGLAVLKIGGWVSQLQAASTLTTAIAGNIKFLKGVGPIALAITAAVMVGEWIADNIKTGITDEYGRADKAAVKTAEMQRAMGSRLAEHYKVSGANRVAVRQQLYLEGKLHKGMDYAGQMVQEEAYLRRQYGAMPKPAKHSAGGLISRETLSWLGEGNRPELVLPLTNPGRTQQLLGAAGIGGGITINQTLNISGAADPQATAREVARVSAREIEAVLDEVMRRRQRLAFAG
jgi:tape measure domain-containing protein